MKKAHIASLSAVAVAGIAAMIFAAPSTSESSMPVAELARDTHFHGLAADPAEPGQIFLATHHGLYSVSADGLARRISENTNDYMGFTPHPGESETLYASGHPAGGGNMGFIVSFDGGRTWRKLSDGLGGPVDFHQMDISKADPRVIYGIHRTLQVSRDSGRTWQEVGPAPQGAIDLSASARDPDTLYAATQRGFLRSTDGGRSWQDAYYVRKTTTLAQVTPGGDIYAFVEGIGLIRATEEKLDWKTLSRDFGSRYVLHLAVGPGEPAILHAVTFDPQSKSQELIVSRDDGKTWSALGVGAN